MLARFGGYWRLIGSVLGLVPRRLLDALYDGIARIRHRIFLRPTEACPLVPSEVRTRFLP